MTDTFEPQFKSLQLPAFKEWDTVSESVLEKPDPETVFRQQCDLLREEARKAGFAEGMEQASVEIKQQKDRLNQTLHALLKPAQLLDESLIQEVLQTILWLCKACIGVELSLHPEKLRALLENIKQILPVIKNKQQLSMHPDDLAWISSQLSEENIPELKEALIADPALSRGDFYLRGENKVVDGSLATRLQVIFEDFLNSDTALFSEKIQQEESGKPCSNPD